MTDAEAGTPLPELMGELRDQTARLLRLQVTLLGEELRSKLSSSTRQLVVLGLAALVAAGSLLVAQLGVAAGLFAALVGSGLAPMTAAWISLLVTAAVTAAGAGSLARWAVRRLRRMSWLPDATLQETGDTGRWLAEKIP